MILNPFSGRIMRYRLPWSAVALAAVTVACAQSVSVPPISPAPGAMRHVGKFVWYDLVAHDVAAVKQFYGALLGWTFRDDRTPDPRYVTILHDGSPIGGIVALSEEERREFAPQWLSLLSVADVDAAISTAAALGATVSWGPRDVAERGRMVLMTDPQGALIALVSSSSGDPPDADPVTGGWLWTEYWADSVDAAVAFYGSLVGYEHEEIELAGGAYTLLRRDGTPRAGMIPISFRNVRPQWLPYVLVDDPASLVTRVSGLGGQVLLTPSADRRNGSVAVVADPSGAAIVLQKWPPQ
jgi:predicted enzyme related to lactoylglutathione lyase